MTIYSGKNYRKVYESHFGKIPKDESGRSYEIHHIDGDHSNSDILNLKCITIQEHYDIHYSQGDWGACGAIAARMKMSTELISSLSRLACLKMVEQGTNPFSGGEMQRKFQRERVINGTHHWQNSELQRTSQKKRVENGTHPWQGNGEFQRENNRRRLQNGTHHLLGESNPSKLMIKEGTHHFLGDANPAKVNWVCEHCNKTGSGISNYKRWHGEKCKYIHG